MDRQPGEPELRKVVDFQPANDRVVEKPKRGSGSEAERIWAVISTRIASEREAAKLAGSSRYMVRKLCKVWLRQGWVVRREGGGVRVTSKAPETLRNALQPPLVGSPSKIDHPLVMEPVEPLQPVKRVGDAVRLHRGKLRAALPRSVDVARLPFWRGAKPNGSGAVYHRFVLPCETESGGVGVPVQVVQPKRLDRPFSVVIQSANILARPAEVVGAGQQGTLEWVREGMLRLLQEWLGPGAEDLGPLEWVGRGREDVEVAYEALPGARVGGDPQRDFVAVDESDRFSPWDKEEEQSLTAFLRLAGVERRVAEVWGAVERIIGVLEGLTGRIESLEEGQDATASVLETLTRKDVGK